jgi:hypothetical protein
LDPAPKRAQIDFESSNPLCQSKSCYWNSACAISAVLLDSSALTGKAAPRVSRPPRDSAPWVATYAAAISNAAAMGSATFAREVTPVVTSAPLTRKPSRHGLPGLIEMSTNWQTAGRLGVWPGPGG